MCRQDLNSHGTHPVWIDQWPLRGEWLQQAQKLVKEQLDLGNIVLSTNSCNTLIFVTPQKSGKWRLLQDLRAISAVIAPMGAQQSGIPNPAMISETWELLIIDLKDCFLTVVLHTDDAPHFAFLLPSLNNSSGYHWVVLSHRMKNSPTICQFVVKSTLQLVQQQFSVVLLYHSMDDILAADDCCIAKLCCLFGSFS